MVGAAMLVIWKQAITVQAISTIDGTMLIRLIKQMIDVRNTAEMPSDNTGWYTDTTAITGNNKKTAYDMGFLITAPKTTNSYNGN